MIINYTDNKILDNLFIFSGRVKWTMQHDNKVVNFSIRVIYTFFENSNFVKQTLETGN